MAAGELIGKFVPQIPEFLNRFEYANVSIPIAILIWLMIYPMIRAFDDNWGLPDPTGQADDFLVEVIKMIEGKVKAL